MLEAWEWKKSSYATSPTDGLPTKPASSRGFGRAWIHRVGSPTRYRHHYSHGYFLFSGILPTIKRLTHCETVIVPIVNCSCRPIVSTTHLEWKILTLEDHFGAAHNRSSWCLESFFFSKRKRQDKNTEYGKLFQWTFATTIILSPGSPLLNLLVELP